ncbi:MAG: PIN domain-containing protein [Puniceicoccaceae bacterium]|nr:MAG: PIN domain-containing protein [Puniceicoccaceae bacterium]
MSVECFLDTNVLVYAVDQSKAGSAKKAVALGLIEREDFGLSAQVLQEFYVTATRKLKNPLSPDQALALIERFEAFPVASTDCSLITQGIRNALRFQISYWDGAILAAAERLGARIVYSEDLNHGQHYGDLRVVNPFSG